MSKVSALGSHCLNPSVVMNSVAESIDELDEVYVVGIGKDKKPLIWSTGDLSGLCFASVVFQEYAHKFLNGQIEDASGEDAG